MRSSLFFAPVLVLLACSGKDADPVQGGGGHSASAGTDLVTGGASAAGETNASGGKPVASAGAVGAGSGGATTSGGATNTAGQASGGQGTGGQALVGCDLRNIACRIAQPICPENQVPSVEGSCFGPCVPIESCACAAPAECPFNDRYTCWQRTHCGPYVR